jgi:hypothetical protein
MKKKVAITVIVILVISLLPCAYRTVKWASDAHSLVTLAILEPEEMNFNPYDKNGFFINQEIAVWILKTFEYPYKQCSRVSQVVDLCGTPLIGWVGRMLDMYGKESTERGYELLEYFISRGEPINTLSAGMAPVHEAILYNNPRYLKVLLSAGADPSIKIVNPDKEYHGYTGYQYLELLESKRKSDFSEIRRILTKKKA